MCPVDSFEMSLLFDPVAKICIKITVISQEKDQVTCDLIFFRSCRSFIISKPQIEKQNKIRKIGRVIFPRGRITACIILFS